MRIEFEVGPSGDLLQPGSKLIPMFWKDVVSANNFGVSFSGVGVRAAQSRNIPTSQATWTIAETNIPRRLGTNFRFLPELDRRKICASVGSGYPSAFGSGAVRPCYQNVNWVVEIIFGLSGELNEN